VRTTNARKWPTETPSTT